MRMTGATPIYSRRIASGPDALAAADAIRRAESRRGNWPYVHVYPPDNSIRRTPTGSVICPAAATQVLVLAFTVPQGFWFYLEQMGLWTNAQNWNPGDFTFTVDRDTPLGLTPLQGSPLNDWSAIQTTYGFQGWPIRLARAELLAPSNLLQAKVTNINLGAAGSYFTALFDGYLVPTTEFPQAE